MMFETETQAEMHSDIIKVSGLYCIKSATGATIVTIL